MGFGSGLPKVGNPGSKFYVKDEQACLFRLVCGGVVDNPPIKCKSKVGQVPKAAVCGTVI